MKCTSCEKDSAENVKFPCPICGKEISRCSRCRSLSIEYKCKCNHVGP